MAIVTTRRTAILFSAVLVIAGCGEQGDGETPAAEAAGEASEEGDAADERSGPPEGQASEFVVPISGLGLSTLPMLAAIDELRAEGYTIETPQLPGYELAAEGVAQGNFHFSAGVSGANLRAIEEGAPLKIIGSRIGNEFMIYAREGLETCEEIIESDFAIHSPASSSGAMARYWKDQNCPDATYEPLIIEGSQNRLAALVADQIDASPVDFRDALILDEEGGFERVVVFKDALPDLRSSTIAGNEDWMADNPDVTKDFLRELLLQHRRVNSEDGYLFSLVEEYLPEEAEDETTAREITATYVEELLFDSNGGIDEAGLETTIAFYGPGGTGDIEAEFEVSDVADLSYLEAVLDEIGTE